MNNSLKCPQCTCEYPYEQGEKWVCPECSYEWPINQADSFEKEETTAVIKDASGNFLQDGDSITIIKDLKVKGTSSALKVGTKVKNIRLVDGDHNIDCRIEGFGEMKLKSEFVRKI